MKIFKKVISVISKVCLFICVFLLLASFVGEEFTRKGISSVIDSSLAKVPGFEIVTENEKVNELLQSPETKDFIMGFIEPIISGDFDGSKVNVGEDILEFVVANKEKKENISGQPIDMEKLEEFVNSEEMATLNEEYIEIVTGANEVIPSEIKSAVSAYNFFLTSKFRIMMAVIGAVMVLIIAVIDKSYYSWMRTLGKILIGCGIFVFIVSGVGTIVLNNMFNLFNEGTTFDYKNAMTILGIIIVSGIILEVIYGKIQKSVKEGNSLDEISEVSVQ